MSDQTGKPGIYGTFVKKGRESERSNINAGRPMQSENPGLKCKSYILGNIEN